MTQDAPTDPEALRAEIAQTRGELGDTVDALSTKLDVTARARGAVEDRTEQIKDRIHAVREKVADVDVPDVVGRPVPWATLAAVSALAGIVLYLWRRRT